MGELGYMNTTLSSKGVACLLACLLGYHGWAGPGFQQAGAELSCLELHSGTHAGDDWNAPLLYSSHWSLLSPPV